MSGNVNHLFTEGSESSADPATWSLRDFVSQVYVKHNLRVANKPRTRQTYLETAKQAEDFFHATLDANQVPRRPLFLSDVTNEFVAASMANFLDRGRAPATANKHLRQLAAVINFARRNRRMAIEAITVVNVPMLKRTPRAWLEDEMQAILTAAGKLPGYVGPVPAGVFFSGLILFVLNTGCRITSVMRTPLKCLDLDRGTVIVPAENQKHRADEPFPLTPECVQVLRMFRFDNRPGGPPETVFGDWPFDRNRPAGSIAWVSLTRRLRRILVAAGLFKSEREVSPGDLWHKFRKTMASHVAAKLGRAAAQALLGHSDLKVTERYLDDRIVSRPDVRTALPSLVPPPPRGRAPTAPPVNVCAEEDEAAEGLITLCDDAFEVPAGRIARAVPVAKARRAKGTKTPTYSDPQTAQLFRKLAGQVPRLEAKR
jgi:integrase